MNKNFAEATDPIYDLLYSLKSINFRVVMERVSAPEIESNFNMEPKWKVAIDRTESHNLKVFKQKQKK